MAALVLTLIGDDRAGLVNSVADAVAAHGGNWEQSQMSELAGKFAGIVLVRVPDERVDELTASLEPLHGLLDVTLQRVTAPVEADARCVRWTLELVGADRPGIVAEITSVLADHAVSIEALTTTTREAPMANERLFEAVADLEAGAETNLDALRTALESLANELLVDIDLDDAG